MHGAKAAPFLRSKKQLLRTYINSINVNNNYYAVLFLLLDGFLFSIELQ